MELFVRFISTIPNYVIDYRGIDNEVKLLNKYYNNSQRNINEHKNLLPHLTIKFLEQVHWFTSSANYTMKMVKDSSRPSFGVELTYGLWRNNEEELLRVADVLTQAHEDIAVVKINSLERSFSFDDRYNSQIGDYFNAFLSSTHKNLQNLILVGGLFRTYTPPALSMHQQYITHLEFQFVEIKEDLLPLLSESYPNLNEIIFDSCKFIENYNSVRRNTINISMPNTSIKSMNITTQGGDDEDTEYMDDVGFAETVICPILLISLSSDEDPYNSKYYINYAAEENSTSELSYLRFNALERAFNPEEVGLILVQVKSINNFSLDAYYDESHHQFNISPFL